VPVPRGRLGRTAEEADGRKRNYLVATEPITGRDATEGEELELAP